MIEKESEYIDDPIYVFTDEGHGPILLMTFYNGMVETFDLLVEWLNDSSDHYVEITTFTVVDTCDLGIRDQRNRGSLSGGPQTPYTEQTEVT